MLSSSCFHVSVDVVTCSLELRADAAHSITLGRLVAALGRSCLLAHVQLLLLTADPSLTLAYLIMAQPQRCEPSAVERSINLHRCIGSQLCGM